MAEDETKALSPLVMDRGFPLGNSLDRFSRRALHAKIGNDLSEAIPTFNAPSSIGDQIKDARNQDVDNEDTDDHVYTVPDDKVFSFTGILGYSTGPAKVEIQYSLNGTDFTSVGFRGNERPPGIDTPPWESIPIPAAGKVKLIRTNRNAAEMEPAAFAISTTILGVLYDA